MNLDDITRQLRKASAEFITCCSTIEEVRFFYQPADKWSIAQNVKHLIISANKTKLAYSLPKALIRLVTGKPNRTSRSYNELVEKYKFKLEQGGRASSPFIPKTLPSGTVREILLKEFSSVMEKLAHTMEKKWTDPQLDKYLAPHPLLGKITLRELGYFSIHHTFHHMEIIKNRI